MSLTAGFFPREGENKFGKLRSFWSGAGFSLPATAADQDRGEKAADIRFLITSGNTEVEEVWACDAAIDEPQNGWFEGAERSREGVAEASQELGFESFELGICAGIK